MAMSANPKKILVIAIPAAGDVLLATPLLSALRDAYPDAELDVLVRRGCAGILEGNEVVDRVIE